MNWEDVTFRLVEQGNEYTIVRPGITLCLLYGEPASAIAPAIANILEEYTNFIPNGALQTYLSGDGTWKPLNKRIYNNILGRLRGTGEEEHAEFHFGQEPVANVGKYGAHFTGAPLSDDSFPLEDCALYLEFPHDVSEFTTLERLVEFVRQIALMSDFDSGYCGYSFKHLHMTFLTEAFKEIGKVALRYIGLDISNDFFLFFFIRFFNPKFH